MVFGWGKKRPAEAPVRREISLQEVPGIVAEINSLRESLSLSELKKIRDETAPLVEDLMEIGLLLERDDLNVDDVDKHIGVIVVRGKKQVIDVIKKGVTSLPEVSSINDAQNLDVLLGQILKKVGDVLGRQTRVIHIFAKKYAQQLKDSLEVMNANKKEIHRLLAEVQSQKTASEGILGRVSQIGATESSHSAILKKIKETQHEIESLDSRRKSLQESIGMVQSSPEYKKYLDLQEKLDKFTGQKESIRGEVSAQFAKISRPLGRYEYGSALDKEQKGLLRVLVSAPYDALLPQNADPIIVILENVRKAISSGSISVKDVEKSLAFLTETEEALDGFVQKISGYESGRKKLRAELDSLRSAKLESMEGDLAKNTSLLEGMHLKSESLRGEADEAESSIPKIVSEIGDLLGGFSNTKYVIKYGGL
ncbi:MAG: exonuclease SbcC [Nitrosopumilus sp. B06]|nr:MAG: exonuclease SbcC [Nitrosopumilus sp. D6]RNJ78867.1 MAG: exonuclease SbcC [Nitrosopumilus sp. B06]